MHPSNKKDNNRIVCKFIEYGMNIFEIYPDNRKLNLLHFTGYANNTFIIRYVLDIVKEKHPEKIDEYLNGRDSEQNTPLIYAVKNNSEEAARLFLEFGAHVNLYDDQLRTSIWIACSNGNMRIVELLLEYSADLNLCSISGKSPHFMALLNKSYDIAKVISDRGGINCGQE
jgi:ankyrin repeat protein